MTSPRDTRFCARGIVPLALYGVGLQVHRCQELVCVRQVDLTRDKIVWQEDNRIVGNALRQPLVTPGYLKDPRLVLVPDRDDTSIAIAVFFGKPTRQQDTLTGGVGLL